MRSSIVSAMNSQVQRHVFFVMCDTTLSSWPEIAAIFQVTSVTLFYCKERYCVTAYLLESSQAQFKRCRLLFYNYGMFARIQIKNGNIWLLPRSLFVSSSMKESQKFILG